MTKPRVHYRFFLVRKMPEKAICGKEFYDYTEGTRTTLFPAEVTCKACRRLMQLHGHLPEHE